MPMTARPAAVGITPKLSVAEPTMDFSARVFDDPPSPPGKEPVATDQDSQPKRPSAMGA